jgi:quercetin dioxygenase-like cupin family protein
MHDIRKNELVEVKSWFYRKGQDMSSHLRKYQREATESTFILNGKVRALLDGKEFILEGGDYVTIPPAIVSNLVLEILEDTEGLTIKWPSIGAADSVKLNN